MMDCISPAGKLHLISSLHADLLLSAMTNNLWYALSGVINFPGKVKLC